MSFFWTCYIAVLTVGTLIGLLWLMVSTSRNQHTGTTEQTTGHTWDGLQEYDNPLPRWWFMLFLGGIIFAAVYLVLYPGLGGFPGLHPGYKGGWTQEKQWDREMQSADEKYGPLFAKYNNMSVAEVAKDPAAREMGARLFSTYCAVCHGSDARGGHSFPNLSDKLWKWGGEPETIEQTILNGRMAIMAPWGEMLKEDGVKNIAGYVRSHFGKMQAPVGVDLDKGKQTYDTICVTCHGPDGKGMPMLGSADLNHPEGWIYGTSQQAVEQTVRDGRQGVMPAQGPWLGKDKVHILAGYVYSLSQGK